MGILNEWSSIRPSMRWVDHTRDAYRVSLRYCSWRERMLFGGGQDIRQLLDIEQHAAGGVVRFGFGPRNSNSPSALVGLDWLRCCHQEKSISV